jgi:carbonic anhydrase
MSMSGERERTPISRTDTLDYAPPRNNVLLLSCMDARLMDALAQFMHHDNLTNRYDQIVMAGAALGPLQETYPNWRQTFFEHLRLAIELHQIRDVYIVQHRNCGAFRRLLGKDYGDSPEDQAREENDHAQWACQLSDLILAWCADFQDANGRPFRLTVRCFLMDLRGHVKILGEPRNTSVAPLLTT